MISLWFSICYQGQQRPLKVFLESILKNRNIASSANVANIYRNADQLESDVESSVEHGEDRRGNALWSAIALPEIS